LLARKEKSPHNQSRNTCKSFLSEFRDERKICKRKEEEIDNEGRESSRSFFFPKFGRNLIIFSALGIFQLISESFEQQILFFPVGSQQRLEAQKRETGRANNSHFELEFE
jgi:hypothetical protein